jgi:hypothetical protein
MSPASATSAIVAANCLVVAFTSAIGSATT